MCTSAANSPTRGGKPNADDIARWDGTQWHPPGNGLNDAVLAIAVSESRLFVSGWFKNAGGNHRADYVAAHPLARVYLPLTVR